MLINLLSYSLLMAGSVALPRELLKELREHIDRVEEILATLEEMSDKEGLERIRKATEEYRLGEVVSAESPEDIRKLLRKE